MSLVLFLMCQMCAATATDISPYAFGTHIETTTIEVDIPAYTDSLYQVTIPKCTVKFWVKYRVTYNLENGQISNVQLIEEGLFADNVTYLDGTLEVNSIQTTNFSSGHTISADKYSITFRLKAFANVTYRHPLISSTIMAITTYNNLATKTITVTPQTA